MRVPVCRPRFIGFVAQMGVPVYSRSRKWVSRFIPPGLFPVYWVYCVAVPVCRLGLLVVQEQQEIAGEEYHTPATRYGTRIDSKVSPALIAARIQSGRLPMPAQVCSGFLGFA